MDTDEILDLASKGKPGRFRTFDWGDDVTPEDRLCAALDRLTAAVTGKAPQDDPDALSDEERAKLREAAARARRA